ncbi:glycosyltransferase [Roseicitreum antarcticum]|uniref:Glycosyltransferase involved in cell wall bisynthesis n=1 Tax=Roseicitreum antarcticum TaxID=564137 RepID=A0A1H3CRZ6_9RHOB|nr:glycosyltransferase [Roseicitreum antarcticum]SDX57012.1 Glycosyltransferase involved in cell wall bisynthesis [Roseicitreum antarcticum]
MHSPSPPCPHPTRPAVTLIVPVHNLADCLAAAIDSLRAQSWRDFEALIIDDGSTDSSGDVARALCAGDARFTVIRQENQGLSGARNTGLNRARGDIIGFLDGDDRLHPEFLARMLGAMDADGADWIACGVALCYPDGQQIPHSAIHAHPIPPGEAPLHFDLRDRRAVVPHFPSAWNKLYRRHFIGDLRFDPGTWFEDHSFFWQLALRSARLLYLPQPLYLYSRDRPGQITGADDDRVFDLFAVLDRVAGLIAVDADAVAEPGHGQAALAMLASRLIHERLSVLRPGPRRVRFIARVRIWLAVKGLEYTPGWDPDLCRSTALVLHGQCPLSVVLWSDRDTSDPSDLAATLLALYRQTSPECEVFLPQDIDISAVSETISSHMTLIKLPHRPGPHNPLDALRQVLDAEAVDEAGATPVALRGRYLILLRVGDQLAPHSLHRWITGMEAQGADLGVSGVQYGVRAARRYSPPAPQPAALTRDMATAMVRSVQHPKGMPSRAKAAGQTTPDTTLDTGADTAPGVSAAAMLALNPEVGARIMRRAALGPLVSGLRALPSPPPAFAGQVFALMLGHLARPIGQNAAQSVNGVAFRTAPEISTSMAAPPSSDSLHGTDALQRGLHASAVTPEAPSGFTKSRTAKNVSDMGKSSGSLPHPTIPFAPDTGACAPSRIRLRLFDFPGLVVSPASGSGSIAALFRDAAHLAQTLPDHLPTATRDALPQGWQRLLLARALQARLYASPQDRVSGRTGVSGRGARALLWARIIALCLWTRQGERTRSATHTAPEDIPADTGLSPRLARWLGLMIPP